MTPSPSTSKQSRAVVDRSSASSVFMSMVLDMTWRLAVAFLVPIIGGEELDKHHKSGHLYLIIGLLLAVVLGGLVVYRSYKLANEMTKSIKPKEKTDAS